MKIVLFVFAFFLVVFANAEYLVVIGGDNDQRVEIINGENNEKEFPEYPLSVVDAIGQFFDDFIFVCGGVEKLGRKYKRECFGLKPEVEDSSWEEMPKMKLERAGKK